MALKLNYRGNGIDQCLYDINESVKQLNKNKIDFLSWSDNKPSVKYMNLPNIQLKNDNMHCGDKQVTMIGNNTWFERFLRKRLMRKFDILYKRRTSYHWLVGEGMQSGEFYMAREAMASLMKDYADVRME